ncbi:MAG: cupin [Hymenobacteraceae bacterium]|nr:cupin [Hymenobacteraceae bacterium]
MPRLLTAPSIIAAIGTKPKRIEEYVGRVNSGHENISVARMVSPGGWEEPGQRPEFEEITIVLRGNLLVEHDTGVMRVAASQAIITHAHEWVRYSTPDADGAEYITICLPAFSPDTVKRDIIDKIDPPASLRPHEPGIGLIV